MPTTVDWPASLPLTSVNLAPVSFTRSGGVSLSGQEQVVSGGAVRWSLAFSVLLRTDAQHRAYRKIRGQMAGRLNRVRFDLRQVMQLALTPTYEALASGTTTPLPAAVAAGDSVLTGFVADPDNEGLLISFGDDHLYQTLQSDVGGIGIYPPARAAASLSDPVSFVDPVFVGRLTGDGDAGVSIGRAGHGDVSLAFVEALDRT